MRSSSASLSSRAAIGSNSASSRAMSFVLTDESLHVLR
jgi:hypothetical protein